jgi:hypothetical protein
MKRFAPHSPGFALGLKGVALCGLATLCAFAGDTLRWIALNYFGAAVFVLGWIIVMVGMVRHWRGNPS